MTDDEEMEEFAERIRGMGVKLTPKNSEADRRLAAIRARCAELLEIEAEREKKNWGAVAVLATPIPQDAAFIAACDGNAAASWRTTIGEIDEIIAIEQGGHDPNHDIALSLYVKKRKSSIITAWEGLL